MGRPQTKRTAQGPLWSLWLVGAVALLFVGYYFLRAPLPFFAYFADPEIAYIFSALQLKAVGYVQMTDHPGTFLQMFGAGLAALLGFDWREAFDLAAYNRFRFAWLGLTCVVLAVVIFTLWRQTERSAGLLAILLLLLFHDYNTLMHFGRFTPEGGFLTLYLPVLVAACLGAGRARNLRLAEAIGWGALLGAATTIKITLWPVTAFVIGAFLCLRPQAWRRPHLLVWLTVPCAALLAYAILGSIFADDAAGQLDWFLRLLFESGRYGKASEAGSFLPLARIFEYTRHGFGFQSYTTLFPIMALSLWAVWKLACCRATGLRCMSGGFLLCLFLSFLIYAKHPYQIKYLLPQTYLFFGFALLCFYRFPEEMPARPAMRGFAAILALVAVNGLVNFHIVHRFNADRYTRTLEAVDHVMEKVPADRYYFSLEVPHPLTAYGLGVREIPDLQPLFLAKKAPLTVFRERNADYSIPIAAPLPLTQIEPNALIFTQRYFNDERTRLIYMDEALGLFAYQRIE
jgi:hypothetical protein